MGANMPKKRINDKVTQIPPTNNDNENDLYHEKLYSDFITNNFNFEYNEEKKTIKFFNRNSNSWGVKNWGVKFDVNSTQALESLHSDLIKYKNMNHKVTYYDSGRIKFSGQISEESEDSFFGEGKEYYDNESNSVKYNGSFEDNQYDGKGTWYSEDGNILIHSKTICNGQPS